MGLDGEHCYKVNNISLPYEQAEQSCQSLHDGAHLLSLHSKDEELFVRGKFCYFDTFKCSNTALWVRQFEVMTCHPDGYWSDTLDVHFWMGFSDRLNEGEWANEDGSKNDFDNWAAGEPNNIVNDNCLLYPVYRTIWNTVQYISSVCSMVP